jgi:hypothetical protein
MKKIPISEASDEQIAWFAKNVQQIADVPAKRGPLLAALVQSGYDDDFILVEGDDQTDDNQDIVQLQQPSPKVAKMPAAGFGYWRGSPMVTLKVLPTDRPGGNEPAHPSINGSPCLVIQRNVLVEIPYDFYLVLKQAGGTKMLPGEKPTDPLIEVDYYEYPMVDVTLPSPAEIAAWQKKTGSNELGKPKAQAA